MTGQSKETAWRIFSLAGEPHHKREHRRRQRVQHRAAAQVIVCGLTPHQGYEACKLRGRLLLSSVSAGMHDEARRQIAAHKTVVRGHDGEVSAQQIEPFVRTEIFANREVEGRAVMGRQGPHSTSVVHEVPWVAGKQKDVAGPQLQRSASRRIVQCRGAGEHGMVGDFVRLARTLVDAPGRAVGAAQVQPPAHRHHLE
jgi:hypothetical protein